ncbi:MAG: hypothetical protein GC131_00395 [Alphaproteobacteria bacterium]|nr:hypothetical protein [Alphaproteobacteria bacterium]
MAAGISEKDIIVAVKPEGAIAAIEAHNTAAYGIGLVLADWGLERTSAGFFAPNHAKAIKDFCEGPGAAAIARPKIVGLFEDGERPNLRQVRAACDDLIDALPLKRSPAGFIEAARVAFISMLPEGHNVMRLNAPMLNIPARPGTQQMSAATPATVLAFKPKGKTPGTPEGGPGS